MSWIVFDGQDARVLSDCGIGCGIASNGSASGFAGAVESVLIAPGPENSVLVARCRRVQRAKAEHAGFASTGILGLDGDAVYLDELPQPKPWWKRIF